MKKLSTEDPAMLQLVNACTNEVQNCQRMEAINTVILKDNQDSGTSARAQDNREGWSALHGENGASTAIQETLDWSKGD